MSGINDFHLARMMIAGVAVEQLAGRHLAVKTVDINHAKPLIWLEDGSHCDLPAVRESSGGKTTLAADYCGCRIKWRAD
jgi:hypothetical protein